MRNPLKVPVSHWHRSCSGKLPSSLLDNEPNFWCQERNEVHPTLGDSSEWFVQQWRDELYLLPAPVCPWGMLPACGEELLTAGFAGQLPSAGIWLGKQHHGVFSFQSTGLKMSRSSRKQAVGCTSRSHTSSELSASMAVYLPSSYSRGRTAGNPLQGCCLWSQAGGSPRSREPSLWEALRPLCPVRLTCGTSSSGWVWDHTAEREQPC